MSQKILLALQYWHGDKAQAMQVARLIADLQNGHSDEADLFLFSRFDTPPDVETVKYVSRKFNSHAAVCKRRGTGWPAGPNDLFFGVMDWVYEHSEASRLAKYKAVMLLEADSCPLRNNWIAQISEGWDIARANVYGALVPYPLPHVNGNCMLSCDMEFLKWISREKAGCSPTGGWDYLLRDEFRRKGWANAPMMRSFWNTATTTPAVYEQLLSENVAFLHGVKDDSLLKLVREKYRL